MLKVLNFVNKSESTSIPIEISAKVNTRPDIEVFVASFYENHKSEFDDDVLNYNIEIIPLGATNRTDLSAYQRLKELAHERDIDILHTHHNSVGSIARAFFSLSGVTIVNTEHRNHRSYSLIQNIVNFPTFLAVDDMVSNSTNTMKSFYFYEELFSHWSDHHVIYNGVDIDRIDMGSQEKNGNDRKKLQIVSVGRLNSIKNHKCTLYAFATFLQSRPQASLVIVGGGPNRQQLESLSRKLGIHDSVQFAGKVPRDEVYQTLNESDLFVIPSHSEGFCVAAVEAMACELPIIASDISTLREVVGEAGVYADPEQPTEFTSAFKRLTQNKKLRRELGKKGRERAVNKFTLERTAEKYYNLYMDTGGRQQ